jgi:hypothetical protein
MKWIDTVCPIFGTLQYLQGLCAQWSCCLWPSLLGVLQQRFAMEDNCDTTAATGDKDSMGMSSGEPNDGSNNRRSNRLKEPVPTPEADFGMPSDLLDAVLYLKKASHMRVHVHNLVGTSPSFRNRSMDSSNHGIMGKSIHHAGGGGGVADCVLCRKRVSKELISKLKVQPLREAADAYTELTQQLDRRRQSRCPANSKPPQCCPFCISLRVLTNSLERHDVKTCVAVVAMGLANPLMSIPQYKLNSPLHLVVSWRQDSSLSLLLHRFFVPWKGWGTRQLFGLQGESTGRSVLGQSDCSEAEKILAIHDLNLVVNADGDCAYQHAAAMGNAEAMALLHCRGSGRCHRQLQEINTGHAKSHPANAANITANIAGASHHAPSSSVHLPRAQVACDVACGKENFHISAVNDVDAEVLPSFIYITRAVEGPHVFQGWSWSTELKGCKCDPAANQSSCLIGSNCSHRGESSSGHSVECNYLCQCATVVTKAFHPETRQLRNEVVECGRRQSESRAAFRVQLKKTKLKGWGVFAAEPIPAGSFLCIVAGVYRPSPGARFRHETTDGSLPPSLFSVL